MQQLEDSGTPVLYIGRTALKGYSGGVAAYVTIQCRGHTPTRT
jgi:hypothetical protein